MPLQDTDPTPSFGGFGLTGDDVDAFHRLELLRRALGVASGGDDRGVRVATPGGPEGVAGLAVGYVGNGTGVDDVHVHRLTGGDDLKSSIRELASQDARVGLVQLASMGLDRDCWRSGGLALYQLCHIPLRLIAVTGL